MAFLLIHSPKGDIEVGVFNLLEHRQESPL